MDQMPIEYEHLNPAFRTRNRWILLDISPALCTPLPEICCLCTSTPVKWHKIRTLGMYRSGLHVPICTKCLVSWERPSPLIIGVVTVILVMCLLVISFFQVPAFNPWILRSILGSAVAGIVCGYALINRFSYPVGIGIYGYKKIWVRFRSDCFTSTLSAAIYRRGIDHRTGISDFIKVPLTKLARKAARFRAMRKLHTPAVCRYTQTNATPVAISIPRQRCWHAQPSPR